jgi:hypothetical protein
VNSNLLRSAQVKLGDNATKLEAFNAQLADLAKKMNYIQAQKDQTILDMNSIKTHKIDTLIREAAIIAAETQKYNEAEEIVGLMTSTLVENRFFGKGGDGDSTDLRSLHNINSKGDLSTYNRTQIMALLCFAIFGGYETDTKFIEKWSSPPDGMTVATWKKNMGNTAGSILINNGIDEERARVIVLAVFELSPVETPSPPFARKRRRLSSGLFSRERERSRSRSRGRSRGRSPGVHSPPGGTGARAEGAAPGPSLSRSTRGRFSREEAADLAEALIQSMEDCFNATDDTEHEYLSEEDRE